jgi:type I restriction enzyme, S subunit
MVVAERKLLGQLLLRPPRYGINAAAVPLTPGVATYIRITDIDDSGRFSPNPKVGVAHASTENYRLASGELVFARTGASVGKSYLYDSHDGELVYAGFLINIAPDVKLLNPKYLSLFAQSKEYWDWVARTSVRSGQPGINGQEYAQLPIPLPDIATQDAVAEAMADVDELIATLERMVAKKEAIKQGLMQQLLTGKTRLPGFTERWAYSTVGSLTRVAGGGTPSTRVSAYWGGGVPWFTPAEIKAGGSGLVSRSERTITQEGLASSAATLLPVGSVLVTSRASIGNCAIAEVPVATNQGFTSMIPNDRRSTWFLYYWVQQNRSEFESRSAGSTFLEISASKVASIPMRHPDLDEQEAIGQTLRDAELELGALRVRLFKARAIKSGMIQQLLTGRTRLPMEEDTA